MSESQARVPPDNEKNKADEAASVDNGEQLSPKQPELVDGGYGVTNILPSITALLNSVVPGK